MKKVTAHPGPNFSLTMPAGEETPAEIARFLDAVLTAVQNKVKRENAEFRKFKLKASISSTSYGGSLKAPKASMSATSYGRSMPSTAKERTQKADNE